MIKAQALSLIWYLGSALVQSLQGCTCSSAALSTGCSSCHETRNCTGTGSSTGYSGASHADHHLSSEGLQ